MDIWHSGDLSINQHTSSFGLRDLTFTRRFTITKITVALIFVQSTHQKHSPVLMYVGNVYHLSEFSFDIFQLTVCIYLIFYCFFSFSLFLLNFLLIFATDVVCVILTQLRLGLTVTSQTYTHELPPNITLYLEWLRSLYRVDLTVNKRKKKVGQLDEGLRLLQRRET